MSNDLWPENIKNKRLCSLRIGDLEIYIKKEIEEALRQAIIDEESFIDQRFNELTKVLLSAFPENDPTTHRQYHEEVSEYLNERKKILLAIKEKTISGIVWGVVTLIGLSLWSYAKTKLGP